MKRDLSKLSSDDSSKSKKTTPRKTTVKKSNSKENSQLTYERNMNKSRLKTRIAAFNHYCPLDKTILENPDRCNQQVKYADKVLAQVPEHVKVIDEYKNLVALTQKVKNQQPMWAKNAANQSADNAEKEKQTKLFKSITRNHSIIRSFWSYKNGGKYYTWSEEGRLIDTYKKGIAMEKALLEKCTNNAFVKASVYAKKGSADTVEATCDIAANWKKYYNIYLTKSLSKYETGRVNYFKSTIKSLNEKGFLYDNALTRLKNPVKYIAELRGNYKKLYETMGEKMPAELFMSLKDAAKPFKAALKKASRTRRWDKKNRYKNRSVAAAFKRAARDNKLRFIKYGLSHVEFSVSKNNIGIPTKKYRSGSVMLKGKDRFCRIYSLTAYAQYSGAGHYLKPVTSFNASRDRFIVSKCK